MIRRLCSATSALSLLLFACALTLCLSSYHAFTQFNAWIADYPSASAPAMGLARVQDGKWRLTSLLVYIDWGEIDAGLDLSRGRYSDADLRDNYRRGMHYLTTAAAHEPGEKANSGALGFAFAHQRTMNSSRTRG